MYRCELANSNEHLKFIQEYCYNEEARSRMVKSFKIEIETFEELPPWHWVYNANNSDGFLKDTIIVLKVTDLVKRKIYYLAFNERIGKKLLKLCNKELPPKMTVFAERNAQARAAKAVDSVNQSLRNLIAYARIFMILRTRHHTPMSYGFNNLHLQLHRMPEMGVAPETIKMINDVLGEFINSEHEDRYSNCDNLQLFIDYVKNRYTLLEFKDSNFTCLRDIMKQHYPEDKLYF